MSYERRISEAQFSTLLKLAIHDLRNPVATMGANLSYLRESGLLQTLTEDGADAARDLSTALSDLTQGLDHLAYVAKWLTGEPATDAGQEDLRTILRLVRRRWNTERVVLDVDQVPSVRIVGSQAVVQVLDIFVRNAFTYASSGPIRIDTNVFDDTAIVEVRDKGRPIADQLRSVAFTLGGQSLLKGRIDGRYSRDLGLFVARTLADAIHAIVDADQEADWSILRIKLKRVIPGS